MSKDALFHTEVVNDQGLVGEAYVKEGLRVLVSSPLNDEPGTNPEELLGLSWATCLNSTIHALLKGRKKAARSKVEVHVDFKREPNGIGYYFELVALVSVEGHSLEETTKLMNAAHKRCPVSKIIDDYEHASLKAVPFE